MPKLILLLTLCLCIYACGASSETTDKKLFGRWEVVEALRNERQTTTLSGVYFDFRTDGKMTTNLPVIEEVQTEFEVKENIVSQKSSPEITYKIMSLDAGKLTLSFEMEGTAFELRLQKAAPLEMPGDSVQ